MSLDMVRGARKAYPSRLNKVFCPQFPVEHPAQHTHDEGQNAQGLECCDNSNKDEDSSRHVNHNSPSRQKQNLVFMRPVYSTSFA